MRFSLPAHIVTRTVPASFDAALQHARVPLDPGRARRQHEGYVAALRESGVPVTVLPALDGHPDSCFVEDPVVALGPSTVLCRSAVQSRAGEGDHLADWLTTHQTIQRMRPPGTLDGGDVMRVARTLFVGRSARTNEDGIASLRAHAAAAGLDVVSVPLGDGLHLKSVVTLAAPGLLVYLAGSIDPAAFGSLEALATDEPAGGNVLALGDRVLVSAAAPRTAEHLRARGCRVRVVEVDEFHKADGALTCLSVRIPAPGCWST